MFEKSSPNAKTALIIASVIVALAVLSGAYLLGYQHGAKDLKTVHDFKARLPGMMDNLTSLSDELKQYAVLAHDNEQLTATNASLTSSARRDAETMKAQQETIKKQQAEIRRLAPTTDLTVAVGLATAARVIPNELTIGFNSSATTGIYTTINNYTYLMQAGEDLRFNLARRECNVELLKIETKSAMFHVACRDSIPGH
jgi:predicted regulator of Ras-like GTPase activity (Roadblock/LC7/MglB family)